MQFRAKLSPNSTFILDFIFECFAKGCLYSIPCEGRVSTEFVIKIDM